MLPINVIDVLAAHAFNEGGEQFIQFAGQPTQSERTIAACFANEQSSLRPITARFDGYVEQMMRVSSTCLVRVDRNRYSVPAAKSLLHIHACLAATS